MTSIIFAVPVHMSTEATHTSRPLLLLLDALEKNVRADAQPGGAVANMAFLIVDVRRSPLAKALQDRFHNELASGFVKYYVVDPPVIESAYNPTALANTALRRGRPLLNIVTKRFAPWDSAQCPGSCQHSLCSTGRC